MRSYYSIRALVIKRSNCNPFLGRDNRALHDSSLKSKYVYVYVNALHEVADVTCGGIFEALAEAR